MMPEDIIFRSALKCLSAALLLSRITFFGQQMFQPLSMLHRSNKIMHPDCPPFERIAQRKKAKFAH